MAKARQILFRIFYSTSFTVVFLVLIGVVCITPADAIYESYRRHRLLDIFLLAGAYVLTALVAVLIYASRLYTNRSVLRDIPKTFLPIEKEDLPGKKVHKTIEEYLERSAVIAYQAKPRARRIEHEVPDAESRILKLMKSSEDTLEPKWGVIAHSGWSSPASQELPGLEYVTVLNELTDLIEAKAVSLAPINHEATPTSEGIPMPDGRVVELLTRPETMGMRQYLTFLIEVGAITDPALCADFIAAYERARFGPEPLADKEFQSLMRMFAELLRSMRPVDTDTLDSMIYETDDEDPMDAMSSSNSMHSGGGSVRRKRVEPNRPPRRVSEDSAPSMSEDELEAQSRRKTFSGIPASSSSPQLGRYHNTSRPSLHQIPSNPSVRTNRSSRSNQSVIRLSRPNNLQDLPYTIEVPRLQTT